MQSADEKQWHDFVLGDLATIHSGHDIYAQERFSGNTPYVTAGSKCNGIGYFVGNDNDSMATDSISVARNGAIGEAHYHHTRPCMATTAVEW
ncbi:restriction endonuclease subunit S [Bifidobacterium dentium]|uniref:restriction endonuclease subunit S n=1 Tax=Bifidobacterium dentium TaxID=1689 RepID=UPI002094B61F|nr:restriction endonuclease subunit S [Bifidobacterium dentium]